jgi:hypothetical protein
VDQLSKSSVEAERSTYALYIEIGCPICWRESASNPIKLFSYVSFCIDTPPDKRVVHWKENLRIFIIQFASIVFPPDLVYMFFALPCNVVIKLIVLRLELV